MISLREGGGSGAEETKPAKVKGAFRDAMFQAFSEDGMMAKASSQFEYRKEQQDMASAVADALEREDSLVVEAGTGVGKSLAYLIPAVCHALDNGKKAIISTHTINLQEQLMHKDIPIVRKILNREFSAMLLKGRSNYLCPARIRRAYDQVGELFTTTEREELEAIWEWSLETTDGTRSDLDFEPSVRVWSQVCSEAHVCTQRSCGPKGNCFYQEARKKAQAATVLIINHSLFFSLLAPDPNAEDDNEPEKGILMPDDFVILDEAHTIEQTASAALGLRLSEAGLKFDLQRLYHPKKRKGLLKTVAGHDAIEATIKALARTEEFFENVADRVHFDGWSREHRVRQPDLVPNTLAEPLRTCWQAIDAAAEDLKDDHKKSELKDAGRRLRELHGALGMFLNQENDGLVYWVEKSGSEGQFLSLNAAPIKVADSLRGLLFGAGTSCILTSATLGTGAGDLQYFRDRVGAEKVPGLQIGSPFDYEKQMEVFVIKSMPDPRDDRYEEMLVHWLERVLRKTEGKAFVLFTSHRLLKSVAETMEDFFDENGWRLFAQGMGLSRSRMVEEFKKDVHSVLFGTESFWAGVDVPGESLSNVIVTRIPFAVPDHPLTAAKIEEIEANGGNAFYDYTIPEATIKLRQGVGRLIRTKTDKGMVVILDNRVVTKPYGRSFLQALPPTPIKVIK